MKYISQRKFTETNNAQFVAKGDQVKIISFKDDLVLYTPELFKSVIMKTEKKTFFQNFKLTHQMNQEDSCKKFDEEFVSKIITEFIESDLEVKTDYKEYKSYRNQTIAMNHHNVNDLNIFYDGNKQTIVSNRKVKAKEFTKSLHKKIMESKVFTKKLNNIIKEDIDSTNCFKFLRFIGSLSLFYIHASSGSIGFKREQGIKGLLKPKDIPNEKKRELKVINSNIRSLYKEIENLKNKKEHLRSEKIVDNYQQKC